jgi:hypothetical protein
MNPQFKKNVIKATLNIGVLVVIIMVFAIAARIVGGDTSMLPWSW